MNTRQHAERIVKAVFFEDLKGEIGRLARFAVPKEDKEAIIRRVEREIQTLRQSA